jgi:hypothetical protein
MRRAQEDLDKAAKDEKYGNMRDYINRVNQKDKKQAAKAKKKLEKDAAKAKGEIDSDDE